MLLTASIIAFLYLTCSVRGQGSVPNDDLWACTESMWAADTNSLTDEQLTYDLSAGTPLFTSVDEAALNGSTFATLRTLLEGFNPVLGQEDPDLSVEIDAFISTLIDTEPIQILHSCLVEWSIVTGDITEFPDSLKQWWFYKYSRSDGVQDSSGFEHVFQGGLDESAQTIAGFYGWVYTYYEEQDEQFTQTESSGTDCGGDLVGINNFEWRGVVKSLSDMWLGKSPELEIGLLTACYLTRGIYGQNCNLEVNEGRAVRVISASMPGQDVDTIGEAYFQCGDGGQATTSPPDGSTSIPGGELGECSEAIWAADNNSFTDEEVIYNLAGPDLFVSVDESRFSTGLYPAYITLLENFNPQIGEPDPDLTEEIEEYLDLLMETGPMQEAYRCLNEWGMVSDVEALRDDVRQYWFLKYSRSGGAELCSSGFEHVFQGEIRENGVDATGFHGWVNAYREEQAGNFVYGRSEADCEDDLVQINDCEFYGANKPITSVWIKLSPEVQMSLMTLCFAVERGSPCDIVVGGKPVTVINYVMNGVSPMTIGSAYFNC